MQKYPSGSRGSPAKGVASVMVARVQISSSAPKKGHPTWCPFFGVCTSRLKSCIRTSSCDERETTFFHPIVSVCERGHSAQSAEYRLLRPNVVSFFWRMYKSLEIVYTIIANYRLCRRCGFIFYNSFALLHFASVPLDLASVFYKHNPTEVKRRRYE